MEDTKSYAYALLKIDLIMASHLIMTSYNGSKFYLNITW